MTFSGQYDSAEQRPTKSGEAAEDVVRALGDHFVAKEIYAEVSLVEDAKKRKVKLHVDIVDIYAKLLRYDF